MTGYDLLCRTLESLGVEVVFGLPGSQNVAFFEALRKSSLRIVVPPHELAAAFMAIGLSRASGKVGVITTIPGPGFTYAVTGLAEARLDSVPLLCIVQRPAESPGNRFQLQNINQAAIAGPLVKRVFRLDDPATLPAVTESAHACALEGEPGPVLIEVDPVALAAEVVRPADRPIGADPAAFGAAPGVPAEALQAALGRIAAARRPLLLVGQGGNGAADGIRELAERLRCPVLTSTSGRGVLAEDHRLSIPSDLRDVDALNALLAEADLVLALGIKFSHNGARGFRLRLPRERLIHVDASDEVLGANYSPVLGLCADVAGLVLQLNRRLTAAAVAGSAWTAEAVAGWRARIEAGCRVQIEPRVGGADPATPEKFFGIVREVLPRDGILVTDSGWHQMLARRYFPVLTRGGLMIPADLQSMGFGLPAAIGARLAAPTRPVLLVTGDGSLLMSGMALVTAVRHHIGLPVIVFNDGHYGLIRIEQLRDYGRATGVACDGLDLESFAAAVGARYALADRDIRSPLQAALAARRPTVIEVPVGASPAIRKVRAKGVVRSTARRLLGRQLLVWLKRYRR
ncbi:MAG: thiamine pyrophosphate-binding protein [Gammaproteobacteria bacterium]|nr:thiamine pyrophosphate-binding protein [Gammaproteobacteria bacterium]